MTAVRHARAKLAARQRSEGGVRRVPELDRDRVYDRLLEAVIFGDLPPGTALDEQGLAGRYGVGLAGVRDALLRLALEGLVTRQPRIGTRVPELGVVDLQHVFEARVAVEGYCAALAAQRAATEEWSAIRGAFDGWEDVLHRRDFRALVRMDQVFHRAIARATQSDALVRVVTMLHNNASRFWYFALPRRTEDAVRGEIGYHLQVAAAIERRDPAGAEATMRSVLGLFPDSMGGLLLGALAAARWDAR